MTLKEKTRLAVENLVSDFQGKKHHEADTETKWIEPLMTALGWDMRSDDVTKREQLGENYPDYTFKIKGNRKFILEAKKLPEQIPLMENIKTKLLLSRLLIMQSVQTALGQFLQTFKSFVYTAQIN